MSSLRRTQSSRANGAKSPGPSTPLAKQRSSQNALRHGLLAKCIVLKNEARENFDSLVQQHVARFQPADGVEVGMIEDMCAACWRLHRSWAIETRMLDKQMDNQSATPTEDDELGRLTTAFETIATSPAMAVIQRYQARLDLEYQRVSTRHPQFHLAPYHSSPQR
jgi:hypothetical protein